MQSATQTVPVSTKALWAGRIISALTVLFLIFDGVIKVIQHPEAVRPTTQLGYPETLVFWIGLIELVCLVVYVIPQTSVLGAILLTGYLGGARRYPGARWLGPVFSLLPHPFRRNDLGRVISARYPAARAHSSAQLASTLMTTTQAVQRSSE